MKKTHGPDPKPFRARRVLITGYVLHVMKDERLVDQVFETERARDAAAAKYTRTTGRQTWKTIMERMTDEKT